MRTDEGYALARYAYNRLGQRTEERYFDAEGQPVLHKEYNCAGIQNEYDERGNRTHIWYCGLDGERFERKDYGAMVNCMEYDQYDRMIWDTYYTLGESMYQPVNRKDVEYYAIRSVYDEQGRRECKKYLDKNYELVINKAKGYAECKWFYNELGQLEYLRYYDREEKPVDIPGGYAEIEYIYDASGNVVYRKYRNASGEEITPK